MGCTRVNDCEVVHVYMYTSSQWQSILPLIISILVLDALPTNESCHSFFKYALKRDRSIRTQVLNTNQIFPVISLYKLKITCSAFEMHLLFFLSLIFS